MVTDIPITLPAVRIRALLDGRMTMVRVPAWRDAKPYAKMSFRRGDQWLAATRWQRVKPGDRLWVRERYSIKGSGGFFYETETDGSVHVAWSPASRMPRWASRLTLIVTATKREQLQKISEDDAVAEGMVFRDHGRNQYRQQANGWNSDPAVAERGPDYCLGDARWAFANLWDKTHGQGSWYANPEVVAISFRVVRANIDAVKAGSAA